MSISVGQVKGNPKEAAELIGTLEAEIERLRDQLEHSGRERAVYDTEIGRLRSALAPFAKIAADYEVADEQRAQRYRDEGRKIGPHSDSHRVSIGLGECRAARIALGHQQRAGEPK